LNCVSVEVPLPAVGTDTGDGVKPKMEEEGEGVEGTVVSSDEAGEVREGWERREVIGTRERVVVTEECGGGDDECWPCR